MKVDVIIERGSDGSYSAHLDTNNLSFGLIGDGNSIKETIEDFSNSYQEMKSYYQETEKGFKELEFDYKFD